MPHDLLDRIIDALDNYLKTVGINPNDFTTLVIVPPTLFFIWRHKSQIKNWDELDYMDKLNFITAFVLLMGGILLCLFTVLGIANN